MVAFAIALGVVSLLAWLYMLFLHGGVWQAWKLLAPTSADPYVTGTIAVVVPARNEAAVVGRCVRSLLQQTCHEAIHVYVVDDSSSDGTADAAREAASEAGRASALTIISGTPLPAGWSGKLWAVQQGIERAEKLNPQFLLLTDADIFHAPQSVATLVSVAQSGDYGLASYMVKLHSGTLAERMLMPAFVFFFFSLYPPAWIADPRRKTAGAAGGAMLIRPGALRRAGGIEAIRAEIIDDCALARRVKQSGGKVWLGMTELAHSLRSYGGFVGVGQMISRSAFNQLNHSILLLVLAMIGLAVVYLAPPLLMLSGYVLPMLLGGAAWLLLITAYWPMLRFYGLNPGWALLLPVIAVFYMGATIHSAVMFWSGRGGKWKGRVQDV